MSDPLQWVGLVSAIIGWATVVIGGLVSWNRLTNRQTKLEGDIKAVKNEQARCQGEECKRMDDHEDRLRKLEHRDPNARTRKTDSE